MPKTILCCIGTRPEVIKMAPVIQALNKCSWARCRVVATAQHRGLLDQMTAFFGIEVHRDLDAMRPDQRLSDLTARLLIGLDAVIGDEAPDLVLAQGDTTTVFATALAAFYRKVPFGHVEAGLRTHNLWLPFPEEANRSLTARLTALHFAPTEAACANLVAEGIARETIAITGNTVIDALLATCSRSLPAPEIPLGRRLVLVTAHRRDAFGEPIRAICRGIRRIVESHRDVFVLWPVHPNPAVRTVIQEMMAGLPAVRLVEPLPYGEFVAALQACTLAITDSGGVQEEAPALGKPVLVMRHESERPEAVAAGVARLVGPDEEAIVREASRLLDDQDAYAAMARGASPYGDGAAAGRIVEAIRGRLQA